MLNATMKLRVVSRPTATPRKSQGETKVAARFHTLPTQATIRPLH